ncbi:MAG: HIT domain-containing protein [Candidatus Omnitrophica bacterium]|nr:HIT domain-containing protein [Candidatus Omnitrophota bacterium]
MNKLWAPWRINYIRNIKQKGCVFCKGKGKDSKACVIFETDYARVMLNIFPYNNGHILVAPVRHVARLDQLKQKEVLGLFAALTKSQKLLDKVLKPNGYNIGINLSRSAGAGITGHLHIHIVPRWIGDTNFMPVLFGTKVISQSLDELRKQLKNAYAKTN